MNTKNCPLMGKACEYYDCALYVKTDNGGGCAVAAIAEEMQTTSANIDTLADTLAEINNELPGVINAVKGLV